MLILPVQPISSLLLVLMTNNIVPHISLYKNRFVEARRVGTRRAPMRSSHTSIALSSDGNKLHFNRDKQILVNLRIKRFGIQGLLFKEFMVCSRALSKAGNVEWNSTQVSTQWCRKARTTLGLARKQARICRTTVEAMPQVVRAASQAVHTCQTLFSDRRWNCSSTELAPNFAPDLTKGTREQAYVYALSSASVTYTIARACASGSLFHCSCASPPRDPPNGNFKWGGCGDNVRWGAHFSKQFTDSVERGGRNRDKDKKGRFRSQLSAVNLHNNRAGRRAVEWGLTTQCKCHGVSGSCNIKTCWKALPRLQEIGERLKMKFSVATEVVSRRVGAGRRLLPATPVMALYTQDDLIYVTKSPDYCLKDVRVGSQGTRGRSVLARIHTLTT
uniref:Protein Wnt n=1 Tax=Timema genevievae TaxID=629358 RepID=A0A7R9PP86_TIMGE|nr:unnamed protein product [Timema genevievae]